MSSKPNPTHLSMTWSNPFVSLTFYKRSLASLLAFSLSLGNIPLSYAQVIADPNAPAGQQPQIIYPPNSNQVPVVNITAPSASGVSRNDYTHFNVQQQGLILNNSPYNTQTQLGGWVQGNPNLGAGPARIILNEVTSGNPTLLQGYIEVGGSRAEVIIANPAGIAVSGGGFINASGVTLTTGKPQFSAAGNLESYRVAALGAGQITIDGLGLDTRGADYTRIIARAVQINSGIWANDLTVAAGTGTFAPDASTIQLTVEDDQGKPLFAIDVASLGGMYAGKIHLIGTEHGVGVRNAGHIGATAGQVRISADGRILNTGDINSIGQNAAIQITSTADINNLGNITTTGSANLQSQGQISNASTIAAQGNVNLNAQNVTNQNNAQGSALIVAGLNTDGTLNNTGNLNLNASGILTNAGDLIAGHTATIQAANIDNQKNEHNQGQIAAALTQITATQNLTNRGLIDGILTYIKAQNLTNLGTGRIYGDHVAIQAQNLNNTAETITTSHGSQTHAATIAARNRLDIGVETLYNNHNAIIYSAGDIVIGGSLDANHAAQGTATLVQNDGATIEALGSIQITATDIQNLNSIYASYQDVPEYVGHHLEIKIGLSTYNITDILIYDKKTGVLIALPASTDIDTLKLILGGNDHKSIITPSGQYPFDIFGPAGGLNQLPELAYEPPYVTSGENGGDLIPEKFNFDHTSNLWTLFGVTAPQTRPVDPGFICDENHNCSGSQLTQYNNYLAAFNTWKDDNLNLYYELNNRINAFRTDTFGRSVAEFDVSDYQIYESQTVVTASNPGQILAGGNILLTGNTLNDKSRIMAGETLQTQGNLTNNAATGQHIITHVGGDYRTYLVDHTIADTDRRWYNTPYNAIDSTTEYSLGISALEQNTIPTGTGTNVGHAQVTLPAGSLYQINPNTNSKYLIETDPRFANYTHWLTSDYMLEALGLDPLIHKRLGDGFYEQQLIREQIGRLTGYRYLAGYQSDEDQYKALMNAGLEFAQAFHLSPGIALTPEQMQQLTSDIVWLVSQDVTLPDGSIQTVLVPQVYTRPGTNLITTDGALLSANNVYLTGADGQATNPTVNQTAHLTNRATITARDNLIADVSHIQNITTGHLNANDLALQSASDIDNIGGVISADNSITLVAQRDINIASTVTQGYDSLGHRNNIGNTGVVYLTGNTQATQPQDPEKPQEERPARESQGAQNLSSGQILIQAGRDINLHAAQIINNAQPDAVEEIRPSSSTVTAQTNNTSNNTQAGSTTLVAGNNIYIGTVTTSQSHDAHFADRNNRSESRQTEIGSQIISQGDISLIAQNLAQNPAQGDLTIRASSLESVQGAINASANTINIQAGTASRNQRVETYQEESGFLSSRSQHNIDQIQDQTLIGSNLSAQQINLQSTQDMTITASNIVATEDLNLISQQGNITIQSGTETTSEYHYERVRESGLLSGDGASFTVGRSQTTTTDTIDSTYARGSTLGSLEGNINIIAQNGIYTQMGSDLLALDGDINVIAQDITIQEARETQRNLSTYDFKQSGVTLGLGGPVMSAIQTTQQMDDAADRSRQNGGNDRMQALAAGAVALNLYNTFGSMPVGGAGQADSLLDAAQGAAGAGFSLNLSVGSSKASSRSEDYTDAARGSNLNAGGNINLVATGKPGSNNLQDPEQKPVYTGGNIRIQGSNLNAQNNMSLIANDAINIVAASNTSTHNSTNSSSSSSMGVNYGAGGIGISGSASRSQGNSNSHDQSWSASQISAGNTLTLVSGGDTNIIGSQVVGNTVIADIGGDLNIQSLQDTRVSSSHSSSSSGGFSLGFNAGGITNGGLSANSSKANANGSYASVNDYAGIMAGDGGFNITVAGNTDLKGAIIASTQEAVDNNRNSLTTGSLTISDIYNQSSYAADGSSSGSGFSIGGGNFSVSPPLTLNGEKSGSESSWTLSGVSGGQITITDEQAQQERTGQSAQEAIESINRDVLTGQNSNGLTQNWDTQQLVDEMKANLEITEAFNRELGTFAATRAQQAEANIKEANEELAHTTDPQRIAELQAIIDSNKIWVVGGIGRLGLTAIGAALSGNVSGSSADLLRDTAINVMQGLAAGEIKDFVDNHASGNDELRAALHAITACAGAAAQSADCGSGALGAASSVILNNLMSSLDDKTLTEGQKNDRINLINTIIAGVSELAGGDAAVANAAARIEAENNALNTILTEKVVILYHRPELQNYCNQGECTTEDLQAYYGNILQEYEDKIVDACFGGSASYAACSAINNSLMNSDLIRAYAEGYVDNSFKSDLEIPADLKAFFADQYLESLQWAARLEEQLPVLLNSHAQNGISVGDALEMGLIAGIGSGDGDGKFSRALASASRALGRNATQVRNRVNAAISSAQAGNSAASNNSTGNAATNKPIVAQPNTSRQIPVPQQVTAANGLNYQSNSKHTIGGSGNRPNAGIEPSNSLDLFNRSIATEDPKVRLAIDTKGNIHRFFNDSKDGSGTFHWSGSTGDKIPLRHNVELRGYANEIRLLRSNK